MDTCKFISWPTVPLFVLQFVEMPELLESRNFKNARVLHNLTFSAYIQGHQYQGVGHSHHVIFKW
jgi:hypothetical protein